MKNLLLAILVLFAFSVTAQVEQYTTEGTAIDYYGKIIKNATWKSYIEVINETDVVPTNCDVVLIETKAADTTVTLGAGTVDGKIVTIVMTAHGGDYNLVPINLFVSDTILFDSVGKYWTGMWRDTTWITLGNSATIK